MWTVGRLFGQVFFSSAISCACMPPGGPVMTQLPDDRLREAAGRARPVVHCSPSIAREKLIYLFIYSIPPLSVERAAACSSFHPSSHLTEGE